MAPPRFRQQAPPPVGRTLSRGRRRRDTYKLRRLVAGLILVGILLVIFLTGVLSSGASPASSNQPQVHLIRIDGIIDPLMADFVTRTIKSAEEDQAAAVVLMLDTPGGLDESMREIIKKIVNSPLPVIAYVAPQGARAASAGTFICMAADVTAMAPGTNLGAAHPVAIGAEPSSEEGRKITNDAAAYIRSLAEANGHNADWAELAVRQSVSLSAEEALGQKVIDLKSDNLESLLSQVNGFKTKAKEITIKTSGATVTETGMTFRERVLHLIVNPNVAYLLFVFGLLAVAYEFVHPGIGVGVISGIICLILSFYALHVLPVNFVGIALVILGIGFLAAELYVPSHGALTFGGIASLVVGSFILFDSSAPFLRVSLPLNIALAAVAVGFFVFVARAAIQARRLPVKSPKNALIGETGVTRTPLDPLGQVFIRGEIWSAEALEGEKIGKGEEVEIVDVNGLLLKVRKIM